MASRLSRLAPHDVVVEYFEAGGQEELAVEIEGPNMPRQPMAGLVTLTQEAVTRQKILPTLRPLN